MITLASNPIGCALLTSLTTLHMTGTRLPGSKVNTSVFIILKVASSPCNALNRQPNGEESLGRYARLYGPEILVLCVSLFAPGRADCQSGEASCNLDSKDLPRLLEAIKPLIEKGYGDTEIQAIERFAEAIPVKETRTKTIPITYHRRDTRLHVELKKDDMDAIDIWVFTQPELAKEVLKKMKELAH